MMRKYRQRNVESRTLSLIAEIAADVFFSFGVRSTLFQDPHRRLSERQSSQAGYSPVVLLCNFSRLRVFCGQIFSVSFSTLRLLCRGTAHCRYAEPPTAGGDPLQKNELLFNVDFLPGRLLCERQNLASANQQTPSTRDFV